MLDTKLPTAKLAMMTPAAIRAPYSDGMVETDYEFALDEGCMRETSSSKL